jgi:hypothetical protein
MYPPTPPRHTFTSTAAALPSRPHLRVPAEHTVAPHRPPRSPPMLPLPSAAPSVIRGGGPALQVGDAEVGPTLSSLRSSDPSEPSPGAPVCQRAAALVPIPPPPRCRRGTAPPPPPSRRVGALPPALPSRAATVRPDQSGGHTSYPIISPRAGRRARARSCRAPSRALLPFSLVHRAARAPRHSRSAPPRCPPRSPSRRSRAAASALAPPRGSRLALRHLVTPLTAAAAPPLHIAAAQWSPRRNRCAHGRLGRCSRSHW